MLRQLVKKRVEMTRWMKAVVFSASIRLKGVNCCGGLLVCGSLVSVCRVRLIEHRTARMSSRGAISDRVMWLESRGSNRR